MKYILPCAAVRSGKVDIAKLRPFYLSNFEKVIFIFIFFIFYYSTTPSKSDYIGSMFLIKRFGLFAAIF